MPGIGIGLGVGIGGGGGALTEAVVARAIGAGGFTDAQARAAIGAAATLVAGLRTVGLLPSGVVPALAPATGVAASVVGIGDSVMAGELANGHTAIGGMSLGSGVTVLNTGVSGEPLTASLDRVYWGSVAAARSTTTTAIAIVQGGTNDLADNGGSLSADRLYAGATTPIVAALKAQGFYVVVATLLPRKAGVFGWSAAQEAQRLSYNGKVRANGAGADYVMDLAGHATMGDAADPTSNMALYADGVHPTAAGQDALAPTYAVAVRALAQAHPTLRPYGVEAGNNLRLGSLANMTETGDAAAGWTYSATANAGYGPSAGRGVGTVSLGAGAVGWLEMIVPSFAKNGPLIGLQPAATFENYTSITCGAYIDGGFNLNSPNSGSLSILVNGAASTINGTPLALAAGDRIRLRRAETGVHAEASKDGAIWTRVHSFGVNRSQLYAVAMSPNTADTARVLKPRLSG